MDPAREFVVVSSWMFALWWLIFIGVHLVTCGYNALYALFYWELGQTILCRYLVFYQIGMPPDHYGTIAAIHAVMSLVHGLCVLMMTLSSLWYRTLTFTPWGGTSIATEGANSMYNSHLSQSEANSSKRGSRVHSTIRRSLSKLSKLTGPLTDRYGLLGVNGTYFHVLLTWRELIETTFQTIQAYRMSILLPSMLLNRFYVVGLVVNCWSSAIIHALPFRSDEARRRFACLACDCALDLMAGMGVTGIVVLSYLDQYDPETTDFGLNPWYNDEWTARALNEFQMVVVVSWSDLLSRTIFSLGLLVTTTNLKELLYRSASRGNRVSAEVNLMKKVKVKALVQVIDTEMPHLTKSTPHVDLAEKTSCVGRVRNLVVRGVHIMFFVWGLLVLGFHVHASIRPALPQCMLQVRPWAVSRPSCFLVSLDCHQLGISGQIDEVDEKWHEFDGSTVVMMVIRHCTSLDVPDVFNEFHQLISVKLYNSTIVDWRESAAITNTNHPEFLSLMLVRVNMTDGVLPAAFLSSDTPLNLYDFEMCITNLRDLPKDLDLKWLMGSYIIIEFSQLQTVPASVLRILPGYLSLMGNPISELPPEIFEVEGLTDLGIGFTDIHELPRNVTQLSSTLTSIYLPDTDVSYFWPWAEDLFGRESARWVSTVIIAGGSVYCDDLERIANGSSDSFSIPLSVEYSMNLMEPNNALPGGSIWQSVDCNPVVSGVSGPLYPLVAEDEHNALDVCALGYACD
ncbi:Centrosomal protein of 41 kDa [Phytophthora pseudosyringae]|uniref:Centrosomal protein of 41 kDa n=1 Tax=Phytophthora pseudosyringae TaxID=221518 RepID=A0A8T1V808_9STRA|nr:Centrosomal protein of 41 kDa [Phytophthora pseudosyringae]